MSHLKGKTALVTGSTSGIGLAMAIGLAKQGVNIMVNGFGEKDAAIAAIKACGVEVDYHGADMSKPAEIEDLIQQTEKRFQTAYRGRQFGRAAQIRRQQLAQCEPFMYYTALMRVRNDFAVAHKNNGNKAACRQALQPLAAEINGSSDFEPAYIMKEDYDRELKHARFNWGACR